LEDPCSFEGFGGTTGTAERGPPQRLVPPRGGPRAGHTDIESTVHRIPECSDQCPQSHTHGRFHTPEWPEGGLWEFLVKPSCGAGSRGGAAGQLVHSS